MSACINRRYRIRSFNYRHKYSLTEKLHICRGDVVSFIGSGGKTTSMIATANELAAVGLRVAVTTTTKMGVHEKERLSSSVSFFGTIIGEKLSAPSLEIIDCLCNTFDVVLIEADGSKRRAVKGWNDTEPVIHFRTTKTVGLISTRTLGKPVNETWVHRPERFLNITFVCSTLLLSGNILSHSCTNFMLGSFTCFISGILAIALPPIIVIPNIALNNNFFDNIQSLPCFCFLDRIIHQQKNYNKYIKIIFYYS